MPTRRRRAPRLVPLSSVGLAAVLLAGLATGPAASAAPLPPLGSATSTETAPSPAPAPPAASADPVAAAAEGEIVVTGTLALSGVDEAHPAPEGDAYTVRVTNEDLETVSETATGATFSVPLPAGGPYHLQASVTGSTTWYPTWYGDTPSPEDADPISASAEIVVTLPRTASVAGTVSTPDSSYLEGVADYTVQAWWIDPASSERPRLLGETATSGAALSTSDWSFSGAAALPVGSYKFRVTQPGYPDFDDQYYFDRSRLKDARVVPLTTAGRTGIDFTMDNFGSATDRIAGDDRYGTSAKTTQLGFPGTVPVLYVASGANWPDALTAGPAASFRGGALLLTDPGQLFPVTAAEIQRLQPEKIIVVGLTPSVSEDVFRAIDALSPTDEVQRIGGLDRYETSRMIVEDAFPAGEYSEVFLPTGLNFPDALSVAPIAGRKGQPVILVNGAQSALDAPTRAAIDRLDAGLGQLVGGTPSISAGIEADLAASGLVGDVDRIAGASRDATSHLLNAAYPPFELQDRAFLARADSFADALSVGPTAAALGAPLYLGYRDCVPYDTRVELQAHELDYVTLLGGLPTFQASVGSLTTCR
ncbi:cell wall-binding repeat-containing protein [Rathayibacter sp. SD072]|uniref:cell wall-binding repeat-containing protein n=1 Tax=Rathayibacter sp. SD072 TaxID=2781731 RepID=UPI001A965549|nr:cell wall-binding repeat-containing protein [Rathayibacter sp. SD072]MBO0983484.1 cell wall-binding repeat-containing protein [Rathayibacter sp. SD072]